MMHTERLALLFAVALLGVGRARAGVDESVRDLASDIPAVRRHAAAALGRAGARAAVPALVKRLQDPDAGVRREVAKVLGQIKDDRAAEALVAALRDADVTVRVNAAYALGEIRPPEAAEALLAALRDDEWHVQDQAAWALRELASPESAAPLVRMLARNEMDAERIVWILRPLPAEHTRPALLRLLDAPMPGTRIRAIGALTALAGKVSSELLLRKLDDTSAAVRVRLVQALAETGEEAAELALRQALADEEDTAVRAAMAQAIKKLSREENLAGSWSFDDRNTAIARDMTDGGNDGKIIGCKPVPGKVGYALEFSEGHYVELDKPPGLTMMNQPFTVTAWANSSADNGVVVARGGAFCGFSLYIMDRVAKFGIHRVQDGPAYIAAGKEDVVGRWVHLAGVVKSDRIELFVDGELAATAETPGLIPSNAGQGMEIGYDVSNSPAEIIDNFQGIIDEVRFYHAALPAKHLAKQIRLAGGEEQ